MLLYSQNTNRTALSIPGDNPLAGTSSGPTWSTRKKETGQDLATPPTKKGPQWVRFILIPLLLPCLCLGAQTAGVNYQERNLDFIHHGNSIHGKLLTPKSFDGKLPLIVFVHGSGPEDHSSDGNYIHLWENFIETGFAIYSWDRPGVGKSQGQWYNMSVVDRAEEVLAALDKLKTLKEIDSSKIGFWGISQAGWVIPLVAAKFSPSFVITVSSPVTKAFDQEMYRVRSGMKADGFTDTEIQEAMSYNLRMVQLIEGGKPYEHFLELQKEIEHKKWKNHVIRGEKIVYDYVSLVFKEDAPPDLKTLDCPLLAIWGSNDLAVPPSLSADSYRKAMEAIGNRAVTIKTIPNADHTLTLNQSGLRSETAKRREQYKDEPEKIFAPGYVQTMTDWLSALDL